MRAFGAGAIFSALMVVIPGAYAGEEPVDVPTAADPVGEVVVLTQGSQGPEISTVEATTPTSADVLVDTLNQIPGTAADENIKLRLPTHVSARFAGSTDAAARGQGRRYRVTSVPTATGEALASKQWGLGVIGAERAWQITRGSDVVVAVVDSGVDATHPDLVNRVLPQIDVADDGMTGDVAGHGTHVAGIIAAELNQAGTVGVANEVRILPVRILNSSGWADSATAARGIITAAKAGADVINLSVGSSTSSRPLMKAIRYARAQGAVVVAAAGNEGLSGNPVEYPAAYPDVVAVSSMESDGRVSSFANSGAFVDLIAPGAHIYSTLPGGLYGYETGTSMAAPHVSAVAGLVMAANPELSAAQIDDVLLRTASDDSSGNGRDESGGYGLVRADSATAYAAMQSGGATGPQVTGRMRVGALRSSAAHVGDGGDVSLTASVNSEFTDAVWRKSPIGTSFRVQVKTAGRGWKTIREAVLRSVGVARVHVTVNDTAAYRLKFAGGNRSAVARVTVDSG